MRNSLLHYIFMLMLWLPLTVAYAQEVTTETEQEPLPPEVPWKKSLSLRLSTGLRYHQYGDNFFNQLSDNVPIVGGGLSATFAGLSLDGSFLYSDKGKDGYFEKAESANTDAVFRRTEKAVSLSYSLCELHRTVLSLVHLKTNSCEINRVTVSILGGYRWNKTEIDVTVTRLPNSLTRQEVIFGTDGPFGGISGKLKLDDDTSIGINLAYGRVDGDFSYTRWEGDKIIPGDSGVKKMNGWRGGIFLNGLLMKPSLGGELTYTIAVDGYNYSMDLAEQETRSLAGEKPIEEGVYSVSASLNWVFDF